MKKHDIVEVSWLDSSGVDGILWQFKDDYKREPDTFTTVGYWLGYHDGYAYVAQSINQDQYGRVFRIPKGCIEQLRLV